MTKVRSARTGAFTNNTGRSTERLGCVFLQMPATYTRSQLGLLCALDANFSFSEKLPICFYWYQFCSSG